MNTNKTNSPWPAHRVQFITNCHQAKNVKKYTCDNHANYKYLSVFTLIFISLIFL